MSRYAEGTTVSVESSRGEITGILAKHGVVRMGWFSEPEADTLQFVLDGTSYRFRIERPDVELLRAEWEAEHPSRYARPPEWSSLAAQEWRRRWRANVLLLKAKLEFADGEASTVVRELMPYAVLRDGRTLPTGRRGVRAWRGGPATTACSASRPRCGRPGAATASRAPRAMTRTSRQR